MKPTLPLGVVKCGGQKELSVKIKVLLDVKFKCTESTINIIHNFDFSYIYLSMFSKALESGNLFAGQLINLKRIYYCSGNLFALKVSGYFCESFPLQKIRRLLVSDAECGVDLL